MLGHKVETRRSFRGGNSPGLDVNAAPEKKKPPKRAVIAGAIRKSKENARLEKPRFSWCEKKREEETVEVHTEVPASLKER